MCTSTAYEGCETPFMCLTMKWEPSWMVLQPQQAHYTIVCPLGDMVPIS
jgi:hypothetical protein